MTQRAKSRAFCGESAGIVVVGGGNPHGNLCFKCNENIRGNAGEIFKSGLKWDMEVSSNLLIFYFTRECVKSSLEYFHITWTLHMSLYCILKIFRETQVEISPRDSTGKGGGNIHIEYSLNFPWISAGNLVGNFNRDDPLEFPHKSVWKAGGRGWLARGGLIAMAWSGRWS